MILCGIEFSRPLPSFFGMYSFSYLSISTSLAFDPNFGAKAGGGCENLTSMQIWLWNDPILTFEDRYLIVFAILYIQYDCMSNNYLW